MNLVYFNSLFCQEGPGTWRNDIYLKKSHSFNSAMKEIYEEHASRLQRGTMGPNNNMTFYHETVLNTMPLLFSEKNKITSCISFKFHGMHHGKKHAIFKHHSLRPCQPKNWKEPWAVVPRLFFFVSFVVHSACCLRLCFSG